MNRKPARDRKKSDKNEPKTKTRRIWSQQDREFTARNR